MYLDELNPEQRRAANQIDGPMMVIAGAGSGKTKVLTYRIANLIDNGVSPFNILSLTFTNKAAEEMKSRISELIGEANSRNIWMGTFHSVFARILRIEHEKIGYPQSFTIYDALDTKSLIKTIIKEKNLDDKMYKPNFVYSRISSAKNSMISAQAYLRNSDIMSQDKQYGRGKVGEIYLEYQNRCFRAGAMDFDDLLFKTNVLLKKFPETLLKYQDKFRYILVDEYQDTNKAQYLIIKAISARFENICVVGDDAQSIYSFRGANIENILNFKKDYTDYKLYKLEQNYRSSSNIVNAANNIIGHNKDQIQKKVWTSNADGHLIKLIKTFSDNEEGKVIAKNILNIKTKESAKNSDFAILYRTNAQSRSFEEALRKLNLDYKIYGGLSFYQRKEIKDLISYFRLAVNNKDEEALKRIINYPKRGIGANTIGKAMLCANENDTSLWDVLSNQNKFGLKINSGTSKKINDFIVLIKNFSIKVENTDAFELADEISKLSGLNNDLLIDNSVEGKVRYENIQELLNGIKEFSETSKENTDKDDPAKDTFATLSDFLIDVALLTNADNEKEEDKDKITLMTIHSAKGLEFPYVFIVGVEENLFPSQLSLGSRSELEEERRLFYVALTRAEKQATISYTISRFRWGNVIACEPSRFIEEIGSDLLDPIENTSPLNKNKRHSSYKSYAKPSSFNKLKFKKISSSTSSSTNSNLANATDVSKIKIGINVKHQRFGKGKVLEISGQSPNVKAKILFPSFGEKQLLLKFAKLELL